MAINNKNKDLILINILKFRPDLSIDDLEKISDQDLSKENKNISRYNNAYFQNYCIHKNKSVEDYIQIKKSPGFVSFTDFKDFGYRLLTYFEYIQCAEHKLIKPEFEYIPLKKKGD